MLNFIPRFAYYQRLNSHMKIRKTLERDNRKPKKWLANHFVPFFPLWQTRIIENKKKSMFFLLCLGLFTYYEGFNYVAQKWQNREPFSNKLKRWIFKEKNLPKQTLSEFYPKSYLQQSTIDQLKNVYLKYEKQMRFGISRKFMYDVYDTLKLFNKDEERQGFYRQGGYYKKRNQKVQSVHFAQFVKIFEDALKKLKKKDNTITEQTLIEQFIQLCEQKEDEIKKWEEKIQKKRAEYVKLLPELQDQKTALIRELIGQNPYIEEQKINEELERRGLYSMGTKDKLQVYDLQLSLYKILLDYRIIKLQNSMMFGQSTLSAQKEKSLRQKIMKNEEQITIYQTKRDEMANKFKELFKKQEIFDI